MDGDRFDAITQTLAGYLDSRRGFLRRVVAGAVVALGLTGAIDATAKTCKGGKEPCGKRCCGVGKVCRNRGCFAKCPVAGNCPGGIDCHVEGSCGCFASATGNSNLCVNVSVFDCEGFKRCDANGDCPKKQVCVKLTGCCDGKPRVCMPQCPDPIVAPG
jgi:hypothetical protein